MYFAVIFLLLDIVWLYLDATISGTGEVLGIPFHSRGSLNPIAPFRMVASISFLLLYYKHSKYAWHVLMISILVNIPFYCILRIRGIYFQPPEFVSKDCFTLIAWIGILYYMMRVRQQYMLYVSSRIRAEHDSMSDYPGDYSETTEETERPIQRQTSNHSVKDISLQPEIQIEIGEVLACLIIVMSCYLYFSGSGQLRPTTLIVSIIFFIIIPALYVYALSKENLKVAKISYRAWLSCVLLLFIFYGFRKLILMGQFSSFLYFWAPLGVITICFWVGQRGLTRIIEPNTNEGSCDTIPWISMCIGIFLGFFLGGRITHGFLALVWPHIPHYEVRWALPCLIGSIAGGIVGGVVSSFLGFLIEAIRQSKK